MGIGDRIREGWLGECIEGEWLVGSEATDRVGLKLTRISPVFILLTEFGSFFLLYLIDYQVVKVLNIIPSEAKHAFLASVKSDVFNLR